MYIFLYIMYIYIERDIYIERYIYMYNVIHNELYEKVHTM